LAKLKNTLVTGGASGLGKEIVKKISAKNKVWFTYHKSEKSALILENDFKNVKGIHCDFTNEDSVEELCVRLREMQLDVLINNAMTGFEKKHFHKFNTHDFESSFKSNIVSTLQITSTVIKKFRKQKGGKIITVLSSVLNEHPPTGWSEYMAQKAYLKSMARSWAAENAKFGIVSNTISPSFMLTDLHRDMDEREIEILKQNHPLGALLSADKVADTVDLLVNANAYLNGVNIPVNAGENVF